MEKKKRDKRLEKAYRDTTKALEDLFWPINIRQNAKSWKLCK